jgi:hypothetical protein
MDQRNAAQRRALHELLLILYELPAPNASVIQFITRFYRSSHVINNSSLQIHILVYQNIIFENSLLICASSIANHCIIVCM